MKIEILTIHCNERNEWIFMMKIIEYSFRLDGLESSCWGGRLKMRKEKWELAMGWVESLQFQEERHYAKSEWPAPAHSNQEKMMCECWRGGGCILL